jgi:hypothetical protein
LFFGPVQRRCLRSLPSMLALLRLLLLLLLILMLHHGRLGGDIAG